MFKYFCDVCGNEIEPRESTNRMKREKGRVRVEIMVAIDKVYDWGHVCRPCLMDVLNNGEDVE